MAEIKTGGEIKTVAVFCGAQAGDDPAYRAAASALL
jgi:hypothetical protein